MVNIIGTGQSEKFNLTGTYIWNGTNWVLVPGSAHTTNTADSVLASGGNDLVIAGGGDDTIRGQAGNDTIRGGAGADTMDGGAGIDTLFYLGSAAGVTVNLRGNSASGGDATGDIISGFENITGSAFADTLTGNGKANVISGAAGDDTIRGGAGADTLKGGGGSDTLSYAGSKAGVTVNLATGTTSGGHANGDVISGFENIVGTKNDDFLTGDGQANIIAGGTGNDTIKGGVGADTLKGGQGFDTLSYVGSATGVTVDLATNSASGGDAAGDIISGFENLIGSSFDDTLTGDDADNVIRGGAGADILNGGGGFDTLSYLVTSAGVGVTVDLGANTASGGDATGDVISNFENVIGTDFADTLTGSGANNVIRGGGGADTLDGAGGFDTLSYEGSDAGVTVNLGNGSASGGDAAGDIISNFENILGSSLADDLAGDGGINVIEGGFGGDTLNGAGGLDTLSYEHSDAAVNINLDTGSASGGDAAGDVISNFENITGSDFADTLTGSAISNVIIGGAGGDTLTGGGGNDTFTYEHISDKGDTITDMIGAGGAGGDRIDLTAIDAIAGGGDDAFTFGGTTATNNGVWYTVSGGDVIVKVDTDGNSATVEFSITLTGVGSLIDSDFFL